MWELTSAGTGPHLGWPALHGCMGFCRPLRLAWGRVAADAPTDRSVQVHRPLTLSVKRKGAVGWFLARLEMLARFMEDAPAMSRAVRRGDAAYIEVMVERGRKIRRSLIELKQA